MKRIISGILAVMLLLSVLPFSYAENWVCACGQMNSGKYCSNCGSYFGDIWLCPNCGRVNDTNFCPDCGSRRDGEVDMPKSGIAKMQLPAAGVRSLSLMEIEYYSLKDKGGHSPFYKIKNEIFDAKGYKHNNVLCFYADPYNKNNNYVRYELNGEYSMLEGTLYAEEERSGTVWLEFYDGEEFLFSSEKISSENYLTEFSVDIRGVNYLTIFAKTNSERGYPPKIICDPIMLTKF